MSNMKHNILLVEPTIKPNGVALLKEHGCVTMAPDGEAQTLIRYINENKCEAICTRVEQITAEIFDACPTLKVVGQHGIGLDNIDIPAATAHKVRVLNVPDSSHITVAEHAMTFILACSRSLKINDDSVRDGTWATKDQRSTHDVMGKTLLIVGLGRIGRALAVRAKAFDMKVTAYDAYVSPESGAQIGVEMIPDLNEALAQADFISLHTPLTPQTRGMISTQQFQVMKPSAYLINMGRGPVVDEAALIHALQEGQIAGAGLDVLEQEPPQPDNPLLTMNNVMFTPHIGGNTIEASMRCSQILATTVLEALDGKDTYNWVNKF